MTPTTACAERKLSAGRCRPACGTGQCPREADEQRREERRRREARGAERDRHDRDGDAEKHPWRRRSHVPEDSLRGCSSRRRSAGRCTASVVTSSSASWAAATSPSPTRSWPRAGASCPPGTRPAPSAWPTATRGSAARLGVASVHQGPGLTNAITGLTEAAKSRTPLLLLAADTPAVQLRSNFRIDQAALVESVGAVAERVYGPATAVADVTRAVRTAVVERRAVVLMLPLDVQAASVEPADPVPWPELPPVRPASVAGGRGPAGPGGAARDHRRARRRARRRGTGAAAPGRAQRRDPRDLRRGQRALRGRPVRGRDLGRLRVAGRPEAARRGRRGHRLRRLPERLDHPPRRAARRRDRRPGRPRRGGDRRPPPRRPRARRRRSRDRRGADRRA